MREERGDARKEVGRGGSGGWGLGEVGGGTSGWMVIVCFHVVTLLQIKIKPNSKRRFNAVHQWWANYGLGTHMQPMQAF